LQHRALVEAALQGRPHAFQLAKHVGLRHYADEALADFPNDARLASISGGGRHERCDEHVVVGKGSLLARLVESNDGLDYDEEQVDHFSEHLRLVDL